MVFKTILVPYDGSDMSDKALDKAVEIAKLVNNSKIIIIHVIPEIPTPKYFTIYSLDYLVLHLLITDFVESLKLSC